jgi:hypothetical protein
MFFPQGHSASRMFVSRSFGVDYSLGGVESFITSKCHNNHGKRECRSPEESVFFFGELHLRKSHARLDRMAPAGWRSLYRQQGRFEDWHFFYARTKSCNRHYQIHTANGIHCWIVSLTLLKVRLGM